MLGDFELDKLDKFANQYKGIKTLISGATQPNYSQFASDVASDLNSAKDGLDDLINPKTSGFDVDSMMNGVLGSMSSLSSEMGTVNFSSKSRNIKDNMMSGGLISKLIKLILQIIQIPIRFGYLSMALAEGTAAFGIGIGGIIQSLALGTEDILILIFAILKIVFKYFACIMSFTITTIAGCAGIHIVTLFFVMLYLFIMFVFDSFREMSGIDLTPMVDKVTDYVGWPEPIGTICYSCFGLKYKLREVISDVSVIEDIGNMISYDFNNTMPRYMRPAVPMGSMAMKHLNQATD